MKLEFFPVAMPKITECTHCLLYSGNPYTVCAVHPQAPDGKSCLDWREDPHAQSEGESYYDGELILQPTQHLTPEEQLELLDSHPLFTGVCPECCYDFSQNNPPAVHWDCPRCGWIDDSV